MLVRCCNDPKPVLVFEEVWPLGDDAWVLAAVMTQCGRCGAEMLPWREPTAEERADHATVLAA